MGPPLHSTKTSGLTDRAGFGDLLGSLCSLLQAHRFLCSYCATDAQTHMGQDTIAARLGRIDEPLPD